MFERHISAELLFEEAKRRGLEPRWESRCGLFSFVLDGENVLVYYAKIHGNSQLGSQICQDKSLMRCFLARESLPTIPFCYSNKKTEINSFFDRYHPLIQKPLLGMRSQNVHLISSRKDIDWSMLEDTLFEQYVEGTEYRYLLLNGEILGVQKRELDPSPEHPWHKRVLNVGKNEWQNELGSIAESIARSLRMNFIAVDFIVDAHGNAVVLELNAMPGLYLFQHPHAGEPLNVASELFVSIVEDASAEKKR